MCGLFILTVPSSIFLCSLLVVFLVTVLAVQLFNERLFEVSKTSPEKSSASQPLAFKDFAVRICGTSATHTHLTIKTFYNSDLNKVQISPRNDPPSTFQQ